MNATVIDGQLLKKMIIAGANELNKKKQLVDSLNVFPVPDGDTGTNMSLTALAAAKEIEKSEASSISEIAKLAANGSLRGARGNSGVILSQLFRGFAKGLEGIDKAGADEVNLALKRAVETAYKAVMKPKEGTILTVARACADSVAKNSLEIKALDQLLTKMLEDGYAVLQRTKDMLPVLKQANVVDAGGMGLLCILDGAYKNMFKKGSLTVDAPAAADNANFAALASVENVSITYGYCTEFFINVKNAPDTVVLQLKEYLETIGDSIVAVNDEELIKIHVHTDHPGLALEKGLSIGSLSGLKIDNMREQHTNKIDFGGIPVAIRQKQKKEEDKPHKECGFISISMGSGLSEIFKNLGVDSVIEGGQTMNPSTEDILNAIEEIHADNIFILPNNKNIILAADQAAKLTENKKVYVVPSKTIPEGIAAMFNFEGHKTPKEAYTAMCGGMEEVSTVMITYAIRDTIIENKEIQKDDILGMLDGKITAVSKDLLEATKDVLSQAVNADTDMIGIYYGADVSKEDAEQLAAYVSEAYPDCELELYAGNQPLYYYIISVE